MRLRIGLVVSACAVAVLLFACSDPYTTAEKGGWNHFGADVASPGKTVALGMVQGDEDGIIVSGEVAEMCKTSGCWMKLKDDTGKMLFVSCGNESFFIPTNAIGHQAVAHGNSMTQVISVEELRHYAQVSGKSAEEIDAINEPHRRVIFVADSVYIQGEDLVRAYTPKQAAEACSAEGGGPNDKK